MNRLWVRFSFIFVGTMLLVVLVAFSLRLFIPNPPILNEFDSLIAEITAAIGTERVQQIQEAFFRQMQAQVITSVLATAIVGVLVGVWASRTLAAPLQKLEQAAGAIQQGQFDVRVEEKGSQEMVAVAAAYNEMAERLGEAETLRKNLLSDVAHELRHPVHVLQGNLQAMLDGVYPLNEDELGRLLTQTKHLNTLVNDLHELAQAEARQLPLLREPVGLADLVKETVRLFQPAAGAQGVALQAILEGELPVLSLDRARLKQVLSNLISNGLQHTPAGGHVTVTLNTRSDQVTLTVADDGAGITPAELSKIFDRFYRIDSARSRESGSTGLGLAIVKALVSAHGGEVEVQSDGPGQGSKFVVTLWR